MTKAVKELDELFQPRSVAIVGGSADEGKLGYAMVKGFVDFGFSGRLFVVNPDPSQPILGLPVYSSVSQIPDSPTLVIVMTPPSTVPGILKECAEKRTKGVVVFSAPSSRLRPDEAEAIRIAKSAGVRIIGPNSLGLYCPSSGLPLFPHFPKKGGTVSLISHSGSFALGLAVAVAERGLGCSKGLITGNEWDLTWTECLEYLGQDDATEIIVGYLEGVEDARAFLRVAKEVGRRKPVFCIKGGDSGPGGTLAMSHTGSVAGSTAMWNAALRQANIIRTEDVDETADHVVVFNSLKDRPVGRRVALISGNGGLLVTTADMCESFGLQIPELSRETRRLLGDMLPAYGSSHRNPVDVSISAAANLALYSEPIKVLDQCHEVDLILCVHSGDYRGDDMARQIVRENLHTGKPLLVLMLGESATSARAVNILKEAGIPVFRKQRNPIRALAELIRWKEGARRI
jgi:acyl-CoA synthetase (NDP forming)